MIPFQPDASWYEHRWMTERHEAPRRSVGTAFLGLLCMMIGATAITSLKHQHTAAAPTTIEIGVQG